MRFKHVQPSLTMTIRRSSPLRPSNTLLPETPLPQTCCRVRNLLQFMMSSPTATYLLLVSFLLISTSPTADADSPTVYEVLQEYDFPIGLLPKGVTSYELDTDTGKFSVHLNGTCRFTIQGYNLQYHSTITGTISKDKITKLSGIQVKVLFFWINIAEVTRDGDEIELSVGIASANFPVDNFFEQPQCGCGFDCGGNAIAGNKSGKISPEEYVPLRQQC